MNLHHPGETSGDHGPGGGPDGPGGGPGGRCGPVNADAVQQVVAARWALDVINRQSLPHELRIGESGGLYACARPMSVSPTATPLTIHSGDYGDGGLKCGLRSGLLYKGSLFLPLFQHLPWRIGQPITQSILVGLVFISLV